MDIICTWPLYEFCLKSLNWLNLSQSYLCRLGLGQGGRGSGLRSPLGRRGGSLALGGGGPLLGLLPPAVVAVRAAMSSVLYSVVQKNSCMFEFPAFLPPTNLGLPMHSPSALTEHASLNLARFFFARPCSWSTRDHSFISHALGYAVFLDAFNRNCWCVRHYPCNITLMYFIHLHSQ